MSSNNASSAVTYTSVSSDLNEPLPWGIPPVRGGCPIRAGTPTVEDQPYADDASPTAESPGYIADSDSMEEDTDENSIDYPYEPKYGKEDDDEDPKEDLEEDPSEEYEPEDDDDDDDIDDEDKEPTKDEDEEEHLAPADSSVVPVVNHVPSVRDTEAFETDKSAPTPRSPQTSVPFSQTRLFRARKTVRLEPPMSASMKARIVEHAAAPIPPTNPTYDQAPLGHMAAMIPERSTAAARAPRGQYDFVDIVEAGHGLIRSPGHDARTIARAADRAEDVGYVRALHASEHRMMTSIEELHDARTDRKDIRLEIDVVRGQRTAYKTELNEVRQGVPRIMPVTRQGTKDAMTPESIQAMIDRAIQRNSTQDDDSQNLGGGIRRPVQPARMIVPMEDRASERDRRSLFIRFQGGWCTARTRVRRPRASIALRAKDVGYVRALQASKHRMMTSIKEVNFRVSYQAQVCRKENKDFYTQLLDARTDRRDIRLEIDVVRRQRTAYKTELHEVCQAYLSSEALNRALLA
ncbi:hypothetical protein Tco_0744623 [Tanacetum coccineum]